MDKDTNFIPNAGDPFDLEAQRRILKRLCRAPAKYYYLLRGVWGYGLGWLFIANILAIVIALQVSSMVAQKSLIFAVIVSLFYLVSLLKKRSFKSQEEQGRSTRSKVAGFRSALRLLQPLVLIWIVIAAIQISAYAKWGVAIVVVVWGLSAPALLMMPILVLIGYLRLVMSVNRLTRGDKSIAYADRKGLHISRHWLLVGAHVKPSLIKGKLEMAHKGFLHIVG